MKPSSRDARAVQIEDIAFSIIVEHGVLNMSMLSVAKAAKASNETLYKWYGDKAGLLRALVERNSQHVSKALKAVSEQRFTPIATLAKVGPILLTLLLDDRAVALNRAAAADASGALGAALAAAGRETVFPLIRDICSEAKAENTLAQANPAELAQTYLTLLIGDLQIRRAIGVLDPLTPDQIESRAAHAVHCLQRLYPTHLDETGAKA